jgi:uncharacterized protein (TIGR02145 family)
MKKLFLLSALLIFACSSDSADGSYNECTYEPTLQANEVTDITTTTAVLNGSVSIVSQYCAPYYTEQGFVYSTQPSPTLEDNSLVVQGAIFSALIENLNLRTTYYTRVFLTNALGTWYGNEVEFTTGVDYEVVYGNDLINCNGNPVPRIIFGTQEWSVENACHTTYRDGTSMQQVDNPGMLPVSIPAWCYYDNTDPTKGVLYNQFAVLGGWNESGSFAPEGWHVPTKDEWTVLENYLIDNGYNYDQTTTGNKIAKSMASKSDWEESEISGTPGNDQSTNNSSGFDVKPVGIAFAPNDGSFLVPYGAGALSYFWSDTVGFAYAIELGSNQLISVDGSGSFQPQVPFPLNFFSVRLVKD